MKGKKDLKMIPTKFYGPRDRTWTENNENNKSRMKGRVGCGSGNYGVDIKRTND